MTASPAVSTRAAFHLLCSITPLSTPQKYLSLPVSLPTSSIFVLRCWFSQSVQFESSIVLVLSPQGKWGRLIEWQMSAGHLGSGIGHATWQAGQQKTSHNFCSFPSFIQSFNQRAYGWKTCLAYDAIGPILARSSNKKKKRKKRLVLNKLKDY